MTKGVRRAPPPGNARPVAQSTHPLVHALIGQRSALPQEDIVTTGAIPERQQTPVGGLADGDRPFPGLSPEHREARHDVPPGQVNTFPCPGPDVQEQGNQSAVPGRKRQAEQAIEFFSGERAHCLLGHPWGPDQGHGIFDSGVPEMYLVVEGPDGAEAGVDGFRGYILEAVEPALDGLGCLG
ncbi:hypothetical protein ES705_48629 [subsurface metagenome]